MANNPALTVYHLGLIDAHAPAANWRHRPIVCGLLGSRTAVMSEANRIPGFVDPIMWRLPLDEGESYVLAPAVYLPRSNWPFGFVLTFPSQWPPT